ncbi:uncharacterized protein ARMOST_20765 [Armillaria ostoyae]|uniref:Uncharacterized protein n=1 Tax=Armillaria ostoyae TaxID=47428 RepID=A0A284S885_ARMOS|nr:uncharacterized protein ARMOST_20765 [Armillaria ostoyae]
MHVLRLFPVPSLHFLLQDYRSSTGSDALKEDKGENGAYDAASLLSRVSEVLSDDYRIIKDPFSMTFATSLYTLYVRRLE